VDNFFVILSLFFSAVFAKFKPYSLFLTKKKETPEGILLKTNL
jgi:hypothetical protein